MTCYEDAMRQLPGDGGVKSRFNNARMHYELGRRYNDRSFRELLGHLSMTEALEQYNEVMLKVQTHYVDAPKWKELIEFGTAGLDVALGETAFLQRCSPAIHTDQIAAFRDDIHRRLAPRG